MQIKQTELSVFSLGFYFSNKRVSVNVCRDLLLYIHIQNELKNLTTMLYDGVQKTPL